MSAVNIEENVARVRAKMEQLAAGRKITLVAATKMNDAQAVQRAIAAGVDACGENRVQEMVEKLGQDAYRGAPLHFIGTLQKNKVKFVVGNCALIHSVNSTELLETIAGRAQRMGLVQDVLLEVNIGRELSKTGFLPEQMPRLLETAERFSSIHVRGLMAIPPKSEKKGQNQACFAQMHELFIDIGGKKYDNVNMDFLSMGMSEDYEDAILAGSNMIRVGSGIFGPRNYGAPRDEHL